jgi:hypothetical protein
MYILSEDVLRKVWFFISTELYRLLLEVLFSLVDVTCGKPLISASRFNVEVGKFFCLDKLLYARDAESKKLSFFLFSK